MLAIPAALSDQLGERQKRHKQKKDLASSFFVMRFYAMIAIYVHSPAP